VSGRARVEGGPTARMNDRLRPAWFVSGLFATVRRRGFGRRWHKPFHLRQLGNPSWVAATVLTLRTLAASWTASIPAVAPALAAAGTPGSPQAPTIVYSENFQNVASPSPVLRLTQYTGSTGETYTADSQWLTLCNGWITSELQSTTAAA